MSQLPSDTNNMKPNLPSIQYLLNKQDNSSADVNQTLDMPMETMYIKPIPLHPHSKDKIHDNFSSLPSELQQLSLTAPTFDHFDIPERSENHQPSWMMTPSSTSFLPTLSTHSTPRRPPGASHTRSISDYSLIHPVLAPLSTIPSNRSRHQTHRRTVSANTGSTNDMDFLKSFNPTTSHLPHIDEHPQYNRAHTNSPPEPSSNPTKCYPIPHKHQLLIDALNITNHHHHGNPLDIKKSKVIQPKKKEDADLSPDTLTVIRDGNTGRYYCPFCKKAFNRPSSLKIHIYSHTGEKPFVCEEEGCGRQFSVQSNMRRHLRIHRLGRAKANTHIN